MTTPTKDIFSRLDRLVSHERVIHVKFLRTLNILEQSKLYAEKGYSSAFAYMTQALKLSESCAAKRLRAARACRRFPLIYEMVGRGELHMSHVSLLAHHLSEANHLELLSAAVHKSKATVEAMVATLSPGGAVRERVKFVARPVVTATVPKESERCDQPATVPETATASADTSPIVSVPTEKVPVPAPVQFETKVNLAFDLDTTAFNQLKRVRELLSHKHPSGKMADIVTEVIAFYLEKKDPLQNKIRSTGLSKANKTPSKHSRYIPAAIKREVYRRDQGQCTFVAPDGRRCGSRHYIEVDHIRPYSLGGASDEVENLRLVCRAHNQWLGRSLGALSVGKKR